MSDDLYDVAIIGAGPAGATGAILLAQRGLRVALVDRDTFPRKTTAAGWLNARAAPLLAELGVRVKPLLNRAFEDVVFYNADFSKSAKPSFEESPGYLIDRAQFDNALVKTAVKAGVKLIEGVGVKDIRLPEQSVRLLMEDGSEVEAKQLLFAAGRATTLLDRVGVHRDTGERPIWTAQVDVTLKKGAVKAAPHVAVILGVDRFGSFGLCCVSRECASVCMNWLGEREEALPALVGLCRSASEHGLIPVDLSGEAARAPLLRSPASAALDTDSHVGKHTLVIGDAGGFISAASNEGIYPAMWSAQVAVEIIADAVASKNSQDELMRFNSEWRMRMADYLRCPNTDIQFLLPLIFTNQPMADRMGAAFFSGENI